MTHWTNEHGAKARELADDVIASGSFKEELIVRAIRAFAEPLLEELDRLNKGKTVPAGHSLVVQELNRLRSAMPDCEASCDADLVAVAVRELAALRAVRNAAAEYRAAEKEFRTLTGYERIKRGDCDHVGARRAADWVEKSRKALDAALAACPAVGR